MKTGRIRIKLSVFLHNLRKPLLLPFNQLGQTMIQRLPKQFQRNRITRSTRGNLQINRKSLKPVSSCASRMTPSSGSSPNSSDPLGTPGGKPGNAGEFKSRILLPQKTKTQTFLTQCIGRFGPKQLFIGSSDVEKKSVPIPLQMLFDSKIVGIAKIGKDFGDTRAFINQ